MKGSEVEVLVSVVTFNDERFLEKTLESVFNQTLPCRIVGWDNASRDRSAEIFAEKGVETVRSDINVGFCKAHNELLKRNPFRYALLLNPDVILRPDFLRLLVQRMEIFEDVGMAGGKLLRMNDEGTAFESEGQQLIDSTGIYFTPAQRHFDRGSQEQDIGQYEKAQFVFGVTGAALLLRREFFGDVQVEGEFLDEDFFAYREDADVAWRCQLRGWKALYEPKAVALHRRKVFPRNRSEVNPRINYQSVKNRFLMRAKNIDGEVRWKCFPRMWLRDFGILIFLLLLERSSMGALRELWSLRERTRRKRRIIQGTRLVPPKEIAWWFSDRPRAIDLESDSGLHDPRFIGHAQD